MNIFALLLLLSFILMVVVFGAVIFWLPPAKGFVGVYGNGSLAKVVFVHVPLAMVSFLAFVGAAFYGIRYLRTMEMHYDIFEVACAEVGLLYALLATVTGAIWAKYAWGAFWNWDPRQVSMVIVISAYGAYFALRSAIEDEEQRAIISAAYIIVAAIMTFINYFVLLNWLPTLHPKLVMLRRGYMSGEYRFLLLLSLFAHVGLCTCLIRASAICHLFKMHLLGLREMKGNE